MSRTLHQTRHRAARWEPRIEGLETRQLLAALPYSTVLMALS